MGAARRFFDHEENETKRNTINGTSMLQMLWLRTPRNWKQ